MAKGDFQAGTICPSCGKGKLTVKACKRDIGSLLGLDEVIVKNLLVPSCASCGAVLVPGDVLELVSLAVAGSIAEAGRARAERGEVLAEAA